MIRKGNKKWRIYECFNRDMYGVLGHSQGHSDGARLSASPHQVARPFGSRPKEGEAGMLGEGKWGRVGPVGHLHWDERYESPPGRYQ